MVVVEDNLVSHGTVSHPDKLFCCPGCNVIIYDSINIPLKNIQKLKV
jgi:hypothetical protein